MQIIKTLAISLTTLVLAAQTTHARKPQTQSQLISGAWQCTTDVAEAGMSIKTTDTYSDGTVTSNGTMTMVDGSDRVTLNVTSSSTWRIEHGQLTTTITELDMTSEEDAGFAEFFEKMTKSQDPNSTAKIVSLNDKSLVLRETTQNLVTNCTR